MGLLSKLKSLLGAGNDDGPRGSGVDVTVERAPEADSERDETTPESDAGSEDEPVAEDTDAAASTESMVDENHADDPTRAAEPSEAGVVDVDRSTDEAVDADDEPPIEEVESDVAESDEAESDEEATEPEDVDQSSTGESEPVDIDDGEGRSPSSNRLESDDADEPVDTVKGIGPAYAERLRDAGIETVGDLATADPDELADQIDLSAKRVGRWVDTANDR